MRNLLIITLLLVLNACIGQKFDRAIVKLRPIGDSKVCGVVLLEQQKNGVLIQGNFNNLKAKSHAFHIHQYGDITQKDGSNLGGHYYGQNFTEGGKILGNLGNITKNGNNHQYKDFIANLKIDEIIGRSLVIHENQGSVKLTKFVSSGKKISMGVIGIANSD